MSPDLVTNFLLRFFSRSVSFRLWLFQIPPAMKNTSGSSKYLWLWKIPLACSNTSGFEEFSQCWFLLLSPAMNTPAISNTSSYEWLQLFQIPLAMKNTSSSWLLENPLFFWFESYLKGLVHLGSSCRSWTTLLLPCETYVGRLNIFTILKTDYNIYTDYIHRCLVEVCLYWPIGHDTRCPYMTGGTHYMIGVTHWIR